MAATVEAAEAAEEDLVVKVTAVEAGAVKATAMEAGAAEAAWRFWCAMPTSRSPRRRRRWRRWSRQRVVVAAAVAAGLQDETGKVLRGSCSLLSGLRMRAWNNSSRPPTLCSGAIAKQRPAATTYVINDVCCPIALRRDLPPLT